MKFVKNEGIYIIDTKLDRQLAHKFKIYIRSKHNKCVSEDGTGIQENYLHNSILEADYIIIVGSFLNSKTRSKIPLLNFKDTQGFALIKEKPKSLYLDLICGAGTGSRIFNQLDILARQLHKTSIQLSAVPSAMMIYYKNYGFKFKELCKDNEQDVITKKSKEILSLKNNVKNMEKLILSLNSNHVKQKNELIRRLPSAKGNLTRSMNQLQQLLSNLDIVHNKGCKTPKKCQINGYSMIKCL